MKGMTYRYLFEVIIAGNICKQKYARCAQQKKWTFTILTKLELSMQVLLYFTSVEILSDLRLEKCGLHAELKVFENKVLKKIDGAKKNEITGEWRKLHNAEIHALYSSPNIIRSL